ncbi:MAG: UDP-glucose 4-epimerase GalE [Proteobacteria bacterium]|nr:UDP-glucose 4-epimerase GalE [Pseudomonadota bacterium]
MASVKKQETILVVGGAGYIGSHMVLLLIRRNYHVVVLDDLSSGHQQAVDPAAELIIGDMADAAILQDIFNRHNISAVMHFAAFMLIDVSVANPSEYYQNNVFKTLFLLDQMRTAGINYFIFSSTAAVFGESHYLPIDNAHPKNPVNPYGSSKLMVERILADYARAYGMRYAVLRYFNACGADPQGRIGELHDPETHLIPVALQAAAGRREHFFIFGNDYDTEDGTCRRDYVHVCDLADAHLLALEKIKHEAGNVSYNLGNGNGFTVQQVVDTVKQVTGCDFIVQQQARRAGDPATLIADASNAQNELGWKPNYQDLTTIIQHAWQWEQSRVFRL